MTWLLISTELQYSSLTKIKEAATSRNAKVIEWSDAQVEEAAQKVKEFLPSPTKYEFIQIIKDFLPQPVREAL